MSAFYDRLNATARRLIAAYGKAGQLVRISSTGPKHNPSQTEQLHDCILVETNGELTLIPATLVEAGDKTGIISTTIAVAPTTADKLVLDGERFELVEVMPLNPGGTTLLYEFLARH